MADEINKGRRTAGPRTKIAVKIGRRVHANISSHSLAQRVRQQRYRMTRSMSPAESHEEWVKSNIATQFGKAGVFSGAKDLIKQAVDSMRGGTEQDIKKILPQRPQHKGKEVVHQDIHSLFKPKNTIGVDKYIDPSGLIGKDVKKMGKACATKEPTLKKLFGIDDAIEGVAAIAGGVGEAAEAGEAVGSAGKMLDTASKLIPSGGGKKEETSTADPAVKADKSYGGEDVETIVRANVQRILENAFEKAKGGKVTDQKQALAIAYSEADKKGGGKEKIKTVMKEFAAGKLHTGKK